MTQRLALSIESSCDETSLTIFLLPENEPENFVDKVNSNFVLASIISSQIKIHQEYGGVIPEIGARSHASQIHYLWHLVWNQAVDKALDLKLSPLELGSLKYFLVTTNPGLVSALRVGLEFAKSLKFFLELDGGAIEIVPVNHLRGHVASCFLNWPQIFSPAVYTKLSSVKLIPTEDKHLNSDSEVFPHLHLLVSGGNTQILLLKSWNDYEIIGQTLDDAVGESLDKIGRMVGLPYPAGISVAKTAGLVNENPLNLTIGMKNQDLKFSYSGMKTAVRYLVQKNQDLLKFEELLSEKELEILTTNQALEINNSEKLKFIQQLCISAQYVAIAQILQKLQISINIHNPKTLGISGGVSANLLLRQEMQKLAEKNGIQKFFLPHITLTGDNAIMIGLAGLLGR